MGRRCCVETSKAMAKKSKGRSFGQRLRALRMDADITLREMARRLEVTPTYLSQVEQDKFNPPTEQRIQQVGRILRLPREHVDELVAMAGRVSTDLRKAVKAHPREMATFLRAAKGLTAEDIRKLTRHAQRLKDKDNR